MRRIQGYYQQRLAPLGLTLPQFFVLTALWREDGLNFRDLRQRVSVDGATLTGIVDRMEKSELVERRQDPTDRRATRIYLTMKGRLLLPQTFRVVNELDGALRQPFGEDEMQVFEQILHKLEGHLG